MKHIDRPHTEENLKLGIGKRKMKLFKTASILILTENPINPSRMIMFTNKKSRGNHKNLVYSVLSRKMIRYSC